jgi:hypothetical protein
MWALRQASMIRPARIPTRRLEPNTLGCIRLEQQFHHIATYTQDAVRKQKRRANKAKLVATS